jgi:hypothetical protein
MSPFLPLHTACLYAAWADCERQVKSLQLEVLRKAEQQALPGATEVELDQLDALRKQSTRMLHEWIAEMAGHAGRLNWESIDHAGAYVAGSPGPLGVEPGRSPVEGRAPEPGSEYVFVGVPVSPDSVGRSASA